jgi:hypothetical protein
VEHVNVVGVSAKCKVTAKQGDQIGLRIFGQWAVAYFLQFIKIYRNSPQFWASFYESVDDVLIFTKNCLGHILGDFFTSSSGRPAAKPFI